MWAAGLLAGSAGEVADLLELWEGEEEEWSNGVVVELGKRFWCPEVVTAAIRLVARLLGIHLQRLTREVRDRVRHCLARTESMMKSAGAAAEEAWLYLVALKPGGRLALAHQHLFSPPTTYEALVGRLAAQVTSCPGRLARARPTGTASPCRGTWCTWPPRSPPSGTCPSTRCCAPTGATSPRCTALTPPARPPLDLLSQVAVCSLVEVQYLEIMCHMC